MSNFSWLARLIAFRLAYIDFDILELTIEVGVRNVD
jgi:hypothetical protein